MKLGTGEIVFLLFVLAIVFSASRMSALGNALGKFVYSFRKATKGDGFIEGKVEGKVVTRLPRSHASAETDAEIVDEKKG